MTRLVFVAAVLAFVTSSAARAADGSVSVTVPAGMPALSGTEAARELSVAGFGQLGIPGAPRLPARVVAVAIPPGAVPVAVHAARNGTTELEGNHCVAPAPLPQRLDGAALSPDLVARFERTRQSIYGADEPFPAAAAELLGNAGYRKYNLASVRVAPCVYYPQSGQITACASVTVTVHYQLPDNAVPALINDNLARTERRARGMIVNYASAQSWYPAAAAKDSGLHPLVIITTDDLQPALTPLIDWEGRKGNNPRLLTVEWIAANYPGVDLAEKMRNCLRDNYPSDKWGIESVLFAGDYPEVPMRRISQGDGPRTDFYFSELSKPDSESWDANGNQLYGEDSDAIEFYTEINAGRVPWSDFGTLWSISRKSVAYEQNNDPSYKQNILLLGSFVWDTTDAAILMELIAGQPWMASWTKARLYEKNDTFWSSYDCDAPLNRFNSRDMWAAGRFAYATWGGHGSWDGAYMTAGTIPMYKRNDTELLDDNYPAIVFGSACSNSDSDYENIGKVFMKQGGVGFVGSDKVAYGVGGWDSPYDGECSSFDYIFTAFVTSGDFSQGEAHQQGHWEMYTRGLWWWPSFEMCEWNLFGNPCLGMTALQPSDGRAELDGAVIQPTGQLRALVSDADLDADHQTIDTVEVTFTTAGGDHERMILTETHAHSTRFAAVIQLALAEPVPGDGTLQAGAADSVTLTYLDADDGRGGSNVPKTDTITVDGLPPNISEIWSERIQEDAAVICWRTDEPASSEVWFGPELPLSNQSSVDGLSTEHEVALTGLAACQNYLYEVISVDAAGNETVEQGQGSYHQFQTGVRVELASESLALDPGWIVSGGQWEFGRPMGQAGMFGAPDPVAGYTGQNVFGYNLNGGYVNGMPEYTLTALPVDCSASAGVNVQYQRWLSVEGNGHDHARFQVSVDGVNFTTVWENPREWTADTSWMLQAHDISALADGEPAVYLRWTMGPTDGGKTFAGWNIDDIAFTCVLPCGSPTPTPPPAWTPLVETATPALGTATPDPEPTVTATATVAPPAELRLDLQLNGEFFIPGQRFLLTLDVWNQTDAAIFGKLAVVLAAGDSYWFFPGWTEAPDGTPIMAPAGRRASGLRILDFIWPAGDYGAAGDIALIAAVLAPDMSAVLGDPDEVTFGYADSSAAR